MRKFWPSVVLAFIYLICSSTFYSCMKPPKYQPPTTAVEYSFEAGKDMIALFDFTATYVDADNRTVSEKIIELPWIKQMDAPTPFNANLEVEFTAKNGDLELEKYEIGFKGEISQPIATKPNDVLPASKATTNDGKLLFTITLPQNISPVEVNLSVAPLKYNKHFAFTLTVDDSSVNAWSKFFRLIHRKWVDDIEFFHQDITPTTGYIPEHSLSMTDGCGNERRFGFGVAIWPTLGDDWHPDGRIVESSTSKTNPYITWNELRTMLDFGNAVHYHNVNEMVYDKTKPLDILNGLELDYHKVVEKLGRKMKVLALPDGNKAYIEAAQSFPKIEFIRSSLVSENLIYLHSCKGLKGVQTYGGNGTSDIKRKLEELDKQSKSTNPYWVGLTVHRPQTDYMEMLEEVYKNYGKAGSDNLWVASWDEVYEYQELRYGAKINKYIDGQNITFEIILPTSESFDFHDISFILNGINGDCRVNPVSENIYGFSQAYKNGELLMNVNFNPLLPKLAEKYTAKYEKSSIATDKDDAQYIVSMLRPEFAKPFTERINYVENNPLKINSIIINKGVNTVYDRDILLEIGTIGNPTLYRIGETPDLLSEAWKPYQSNIPYTLSSSYGNKTVYVQLGDGRLVSKVVFKAVTYSKTPTQGTISRDAAQSYREKYNGHKVTVNKTIKVKK